MEKKATLLPQSMPDYITYEIAGSVSLRPDGFDPCKDNKIAVENLTKEEAVKYAELIKNTFISHWKHKQNK